MTYARKLFDLTKLQCDILLLFVTETEKEALEEVARSLNLGFEELIATNPHQETHNSITYYSFGMVGDYRVNAIRTKMGPFGYYGSASTAIYLQILTGARSIIQVGMAFGINPKEQNFGDVLVATSIIPYDSRRIIGARQTIVERYLEEDFGFGGIADMTRNPIDRVVDHSENDQGYKVDYGRAKRRLAKKSLVNMFILNRKVARGYNVHFGAILSGGAQVQSRSFVKELVNGVPQVNDGIVGGEMEAVGLLSVCPPENPVWGLVKGISDFGDENRDNVICEYRGRACRNAAELTLLAILNTMKIEQGPTLKE